MVALKLGALATLMLLVSGCGSLSRMVGGDRQTASARARAARGQATVSTRLLATYLVRVNGGDGAMEFTPVSLPSSARPLSGRPRGVRTQATNFGPADRLTISGLGTHSGGELSGSVTIATTGGVVFSDVRAVIASISTSSVTVKNPSGFTTLTGANRPYFDHGQVGPGSASAKTWTFVNASAVSFTFRVSIYANVWNYAAADGGPVGGLCFLNTTTGWAVGAGGKIFMTADGGSTWRAQSSATTRGLNDVHFVDANRGWAVGEAGTILATVNGGRTWEMQNATVSVNLNAVRFLNATQGWIAGSFDTEAGLATLLVTTNGGASWARVSASLPEASLIGLDITTDGGTRLTVVGVGNQATILRSNNGGVSWDEQALPLDLDPFVSLQSVDFVSANRGWVVGTLGTILFTDDGGVSWTQQAPPTSANLYDVAFAGNSLGWCVGQGGTILKTTNAGSSWSPQTSPVGNDLQGVAALTGDSQRAWASGAGGALLRTTNGGGAWSAPSAASNSAYNAVKFFDANTGWVVGANGTMLRTTNGGSNWTRMTGTIRTLTDIDFVNSSTGWTVGALSTILKSTNGGTSWSPLPLPPAVTGAFNGVRLLSTTTTVIVGNGTHGITQQGTPFNTGLYIRTTDGGSTWQVRPTPAEGKLPSLNAVDFADSQTGWIVGSSGHIMKTTNGGASWSAQSSPAGQALLAVKAIDSVRACAVGQGGRIFRTNDGATWEEQFSGVSVDLNGVDFVDANRGWIVGAGATVLRTIDGGENWTPVETYSNVRLNGICFLGADSGWIVGANGLIKRYN
jgi:photosystem II stability/assembly factor-like uncharacterized protein